MKRTFTQVPLFAFALALSTNGIAADSVPPPAAARAKAETARSDAETARADAESARRELDSMRDQMRELSRKMAEVSAKLGDVGPRAYAYRYLGNPDRGMIGVVFSDDDASATKGLRVDAVTPGGPADKAGIRHGDVIIAVNGNAVANGSKIEWPQNFKDLKIGQSIALSVMRDGKKNEIAVKAERREPYNFGEAFTGMDADDMHELAELGKHGVLPPDFDQHIHETVERAMSHAHVAERVAERAGEQVRRALDRVNFSTPWWGLNLVSLNPDLGGYFGTDKGVLVLSANDSLKGIKPGDVLLDVAGQKVERPEDALRLLREQPAGSEVKVQVLRQRKPLTLSMQRPEFKGIFVPPPPPPPPPVPPVPPVAPVPPAHAPPPPAPPVPPVPPRDDRDEA
jgi:membrane-associated protease RseP (regulator of RpoE activity)